VDILINNAGVALHPEARTEDGHEMHLQTNYLSNTLILYLRDYKVECYLHLIKKFVFIKIYIKTGMRALSNTHSSLVN
jgi:NAD(P)-dependent dehydrogenase (short-subunit alcohol dehydrogenase family)